VRPHFATGHPFAGALLALWSVGVVATIDDLLKPVLIGRGPSVHVSLVFFALLGGLATFGPVGVIAGPLAPSLFLAAVRMWHRTVEVERPADSRIPGGEAMRSLDRRGFERNRSGAAGGRRRRQAPLPRRSPSDQGKGGDEQDLHREPHASDVGARRHAEPGQDRGDGGRDGTRQHGVQAGTGTGSELTLRCLNQQPTTNAISTSATPTIHVTMGESPKPYEWSPVPRT